MEEGFIEANSDDLPKVSVDMIVRFFATNTAIKSKTSKCLGESYGDRAIKSVLLRRESNLCTVKCRVVPERGGGLDGSGYRASVLVDEDMETVFTCQCDDCNEFPDLCRHGEALLLWLHRRSEETREPATACSDTDSVPSPPPLQNCKPFMTAKEMFGGTDQELKSNDAVFNEFIRIAKEKNIQCNLTRYLFPSPVGLSLHLLCCETRATDARSLLAAIANTLRKRQGHADTPRDELWYGRIKDSMIYEAVYCPEQHQDLVEAILGEDLRYTAEEVAKRKLLKEEALKEICRTENITVSPCSALLSVAYPALGVEPDALSDDLVIEIKCPDNRHERLSYIKDNQLAQEYWVQLQSQMYFSNKKKALLCVVAADQLPEMLLKVYVPYDSSIVSLLEQAQQFWIDTVFPELKRIYDF